MTALNTLEERLESSLDQSSVDVRAWCSSGYAIERDTRISLLSSTYSDANINRAYTFSRLRHRRERHSPTRTSPTNV